MPSLALLCFVPCTVLLCCAAVLYCTVLLQIASFLVNKSTEDAVAFYYSTKKLANYKNLLRAHCSSRFRRSERERDREAALAQAAGPGVYENWLQSREDEHCRVRLQRTWTLTTNALTALG